MASTSTSSHDTSAPAAGSEPELVETYQQETPTASHALAEDVEAPSVETKIAGEQVAQQNETEVKNLGWGREGPPPPMVRGLRNEELWTLIRRFDKQVFHVKSIDEPPLANLDLNVADDEDFSPDKLRAQLERLYMVVLVGLFSTWKHIVRLRSWREWQRTSAFLAVYVVAWFFDLLVPAIAAFLVVLVVYPPARNYCFPPAPPSLIDPKTGGVQKPAAGVLASDDSMTGAPEKHQGEAVEQEAHSFVNSLSTIVISAAAGKHPQGDPHEDNVAPDPTELTEHVAHARDHTDGDIPTVEHDRTKEPVSKAVWSKARPVMHAMADFVDTWEKFGNALSPTAPFNKQQPQLRLAACLVPVLVGSYFTTSYMLLKGIGFSVGFAFFGDPVITPAITYMNTHIPNWQRYLELRNTLLRGIPTNAQLVVTLLRIGEHNKAPIPPPPTTDEPPPVKPHATAGENLEHLEGATDEEIEEAIEPDASLEMDGRDENDYLADKHHKKPGKAKRILNLVKGTARGGVQTALTADKAKAKAGARHARNRLGAVKGSRPLPDRGPVSFPARYHGHKGFAYLTTTATTPAISWASGSLDDGKPAEWSVTIGDIAELKKVGGLGWKTKIVVGWAMGSEIVDGLVIQTRGGEDFHLTAIAKRDELFNRLIAMGSQMWEAW